MWSGTQKTIIAFLAFTCLTAVAQELPIDYNIEYNGTMQHIYQNAVPGEIVVSKMSTTVTPLVSTQKKMVIIPIEITGITPAVVTKTDLSNFWINTFGPYIKTCTFSQVSLDTVIADPVKLPSSGRFVSNTTSIPYDSSGCNGTNLMAWAMLAERRVGAVAQGASFTYLILPPLPNCNWEALSTHDCVKDNGRCYSWINSQAAYKIETYARAFGRNFGFGNGVNLTFQFGDTGCAMGSCPVGDKTCGPRCYNAVYSNKAGWSTPQAIIHRNTLVAGTWNTYMVSGFMSTPMNHLQMVWNETHKIYISMRTPLSQDVFMGTNNYYKIQVHTHDVTAPLVQSVRIGTVSVGQVWTPPTDTWVSVRIRYDNMYDAFGTAKISMCIPYATRELIFNDGLDDDCDTFVDLADVQDLCPSHYRSSVP